MDIQNPQQLSLKELSEWYKVMLEAVQFLDENIKRKLEEILQKGKLHAEELLSSPQKLREQIDEYMQSVRPFEWNRDNRGKRIEANIKKDWEQHDNLTIFAMLLGDESFLKKWGVDVPLTEPNCPGLADCSHDYLEVLKSAKEECGSANHRRYYDYLINELTPHLSGERK